MLPVLTKAVGAFTSTWAQITSFHMYTSANDMFSLNPALQAQFSQISQFFDSVVSLLADVLQPSVQRWATTMENTATLGGVKVGGENAYYYGV